jgi:hypothetical protein
MDSSFAYPEVQQLCDQLAKELTRIFRDREDASYRYGHLSGAQATVSYLKSLNYAATKDCSLGPYTDAIKALADEKEFKP